MTEKAGFFNLNGACTKISDVLNGNVIQLKKQDIYLTFKILLHNLFFCLNLIAQLLLPKIMLKFNCLTLTT